MLERWSCQIKDSMHEHRRRIGTSINRTQSEELQCWKGPKSMADIRSAVCDALHERVVFEIYYRPGGTVSMVVATKFWDSFHIEQVSGAVCRQTTEYENSDASQTHPCLYCKQGQHLWLLELNLNDTVIQMLWRKSVIHWLLFRVLKLSLIALKSKQYSSTSRVVLQLQAKKNLGHDHVVASSLLGVLDKPERPNQHSLFWVWCFPRFRVDMYRNFTCVFSIYVFCTEILEQVLQILACSVSGRVPVTCGLLFCEGWLLFLTQSCHSAASGSKVSYFSKYPITKQRIFIVAEFFDSQKATLPPGRPRAGEWEPTVRQTRPYIYHLSMTSSYTRIWTFVAPVTNPSIKPIGILPGTFLDINVAISTPRMRLRIIPSPNNDHSDDAHSCACALYINGFCGFVLGILTASPIDWIYLPWWCPDLSSPSRLERLLCTS